MPRKLDDIIAELDKPAEQPKQAAPSFDVNESIDRNATLHGIPLEIAHAMITQESGKKADAQSNKGAYGFAQLMPATAQELGVDINDPEQNVEGGMRYLRMMYDKYGSYDKALAAYNAGPGAVDKYKGIPPFKETQSYVKNILGNAKATQPTEVEDKKQEPRTLDKIIDDIGDVEQPVMPLVPGQELAGPPTNLPTPVEEPVDNSTPMDETLGVPQGVLAALTGGLSAPYTTLLHPQEALDTANAFAYGLGEGTGYNKFVKPAIRTITDPIAEFLSPGSVSGQQKLDAAQVQSAEEHPIANLGGELTSILAGPVGAITAPAKTGFLARAGQLGLEGLAQGGAYDLLANEEATPQSVAESALLGGLMNPAVGGALAGVSKAVKGFGKSLVNFVIRADKPEAAQYIIDNIGATTSRQSAITKNNQIMKQTEKALNDHLDELEKVSKKTINMKTVAQDPAILKNLESLDNVDERAQVTKLLNKLAKYEERGSIPIKEAQKLKQDLYKQANFNRQSQKYNLSEFQKQVALKLKNSIEEVSGSDLVKQLNNKWAQGIDVADALEAMGGPTKLRAYIEAVTALTNPTTIPALVGGRALTTVPGATTTGAITNTVGNITEKLAPEIQAILNALVPQKVQGK